MNMQWGLVLYRYLSWFFTSLFYLMGVQEYQLFFKIGVILTLLMAGYLAVKLYEHNKDFPAVVLGVVVVETIGIAVLLIPTGGINSPFLWYALNPIFVTAVFFSGIYCWGVLGTFLAIASASSYLYYNSMLYAWRDNLWMLLVFLLMTTAAQLFSRMYKQLSKAYVEISNAHKLNKQSFQHISALYQAIEAFSSGGNLQHLAKLFADYSRKLTGSQVGFCYLRQNDSCFKEVSGSYKLLLKDNYDNVIWNKLSKSEHREKFFHLPLDEVDGDSKELVSVQVRSPGKHFGYLGCLIPAEEYDRKEIERSINFLAELGAIVLERCKADELAARLLVSEEQNRIANEIHDGVSQYLFGIVYTLESLSEKKANMQDEEVKKQFDLIINAARQASQELRASIYSISPLKRGEQVFVSGLASYLDCLARLNNIIVSFIVKGHEDLLSPTLKESLYRVIREAVFNAVRHGKCTNIEVVLEMSTEEILLEITDNGEGFDVNYAWGKGLGLNNIKNLITSFNGDFKIDSDIGTGTKITCELASH